MRHLSIRSQVDQFVSQKEPGAGTRWRTADTSAVPDRVPYDPPGAAVADRYVARNARAPHRARDHVRARLLAVAQIGSGSTRPAAKDYATGSIRMWRRTRGAQLRCGMRDAPGETVRV